MTDEDQAPASAGQHSDARAKLLEEQEARIAALRAAVVSGRVPDEATFDYARFFGGPAKGEAPEG